MQSKYFYALACAILCVCAMYQDSDEECDKEVASILAGCEATDAPAMFVANLVCDEIFRDAADDLSQAGPSGTDTSLDLVTQPSSNPNPPDGNTCDGKYIPSVDCRTNIMTISRDENMTDTEWLLVKARVKKLLYRRRLRPQLRRETALKWSERRTDWVDALKEHTRLFIKIQDDMHMLQYVRPDGMTLELWAVLSRCVKRSIDKALGRWRLRQD